MDDKDYGTREVQKVFREKSAYLLRLEDKKNMAGVFRELKVLQYT